jgi:site-specific recombinase XerD
VLRRFAEFLDGSTPRPAALAELTAEHPVGFARWVSDGGRAPRTTVQLYTTAVTRLYAYIVREDLRPDLPLPKIQLRLQQLRGKRPKRLPRVPTDDLMERVVAAAHAVPPARSPVGERLRLCNVAIVETLRGLGVRVSELVSRPAVGRRPPGTVEHPFRRTASVRSIDGAGVGALCGLLPCWTIVVGHAVSRVLDVYVSDS